MDLATVLGIVTGTALIAITAVKGGSADMFVSLPGLIIVFGGVVSGIFIRYRMDEVLLVAALITRCFVDKRQNVHHVITQLVDMADLSRKEGILALERVKSDHPFLQTAINHCVDGADPDFLASILGRDIDYMTERHEKGIRMLEVMGEMAPAFGMLATLIGLVQVFGGLGAPDALGPAVGMTLLGTLYGAALAHVFMFPLAAKLSLYHEDERRVHQVIKDGILAIQRGVNPHMMQVALKAALPPKARKRA